MNQNEPWWRHKSSISDLTNLIKSSDPNYASVHVNKSGQTLNLQTTKATEKNN